MDITPIPKVTISDTVHQRGVIGDLFRFTRRTIYHGGGQLIGCSNLIIPLGKKRLRSKTLSVKPSQAVLSPDRNVNLDEKFWLFGDACLVIDIRFSTKENQNFDQTIIDYKDLDKRMAKRYRIFKGNPNLKSLDYGQMDVFCKEEFNMKFLNRFIIIVPYHGKINVQEGNTEFQLERGHIYCFDRTTSGVDLIFRNNSTRYFKAHVIHCDT